MRKRSSPATFNLSFLDIMFCGFGAVVLLVLIINSNMVRTRKQHHLDLRAEVVRLELEARAGRENLDRLRSSLAEKERTIEAAAGRTSEVIALVRGLEEEIAGRRQQASASREDIQVLRTQLQSLESEVRRLSSEAEIRQERGDRIRRFEGEGNRQYLTGLKLGGKRVLLLIDSSASMLDETIVNVIRRRNMDDRVKQQSPKWRRARRTAEWLVANLAAESSLQAYVFNTGAASLAPEHRGWVRAVDSRAVGEMMANLRGTVPGGGTSLENAFRLAADLQPRPDNILLITDGLPTQGERAPYGSTVSGEERLKYFARAVAVLPRDIPVNTILFPMEGDPMAAVQFWKLAVESKGSFFTPTRDWP
jgi:polyhydroxyalkanoate synthesis regulator phasin